MRVVKPHPGKHMAAGIGFSDRAIHVRNNNLVVRAPAVHTALNARVFSFDGEFNCVFTNDYELAYLFKILLGYFG